MADGRSTCLSRPSVIGHRLSVISHQLSVIGHQSLAIHVLVSVA
jgi:hypothetical protein